jgi:hypothetical protein
MIAGPWQRQIKDGVMSDDSDHTIATATVASEDARDGAAHAGGVLIP